MHWVPPADDAGVDGDPAQLRDVFVNLVENAVDAAGPGGEVSILLRREGPSAIVEVSDTGPGPGPDVEGRLFEPFVTGKPEGVGLGLAVARHAAGSHGGRIVWRREGGRTVFRVELPATGPLPETGSEVGRVIG
jgi:signal transduction histidine kinase